MVKTITLTAGTPQTVKFSEAYPFYWIDNKTSGDVYASVGGTPEADADGTYTIAAGSQLRISGGDFNNCLTLLGEGKVQVVASAIASCPFKSSAKGGDSGGGATITVDNTLSSTSTNPVQNKVINAALNNKADITAIPTSLPANGGDADTVNGHTVEADVPSNAKFTDTTYSNATTSAAGLMSADDKAKLDGIEDGANYYTKTMIDAKLDEKAESEHTHSKQDITDFPTIPTKTSQLENDSNFVNQTALDNGLSEKASKALYDDTTINVGRKADTTVGSCSTAEGYSTTASGGYSHAEGHMTTASNGACHAEGHNTTASGNWGSHAEGYATTASSNFSHAEGRETTASGEAAHAEGNKTTASGNFGSHAEGDQTIASAYFAHAEGHSTIANNDSSHAGGHFNAAMITGGAQNNTVGTAFVIGNGTSSTTLSNAFSVQFSGVVKAKSTITASTTADYAEFFEWLDGNPDNDDRIGYFVTLDGDKIRIATAADDYILGVVSGEPFVLGNGDCDTWNGMFLRDEFRRTIYEPAPKIVEVDGEFVEVEGEFEGTRPKLNPEYDYTQKYISRFERKEWAPIGMLGVLPVRHDGTAIVNGYVTVNADGIATACEKGAENAYRVIKSNTDSVVEIIFR